MKRHMEKVRGDLADLGALAGKTEAAERNILASAEARLGAVVAEMKTLRPGIEAKADGDHQRYLDLTAEHGQLHLVISRAQKALGL